MSLMQDKKNESVPASVAESVTSVFVKSFLLLMSLGGLLLSATNVHAAACTAIATGNWNAQTTWGAAGTGCVGAAGGIPGAADTVTVPTTRIVTVTAAAAATSLTVTSTGSLVNNSTLTVSATLAGTGVLTNSATGTLNIGGSATITTLNASTVGNTVSYTGAAAQTIIPTTYATLTTSGAGVKTNSGVVTVNTALTGTNLTNAATGALNLAGTSSITTLTNAGAITKTGAGAISTALASFTNAATGTVNLNGTGTLTGLTNSGIVNLTSSGTITSLTNAATGTLNISAATVPTITTLTATAVGNIVNYTGTGQTIKATSYSKLNINGTATNTGTTTVATALGGTGTLTNGAAASVLNIGGTSTITGLTATFVGNTVNYTGAAAQTIYPTAYNKLGTSGAGAKTIAAAPAAAITVAGTLVVTGGALTNNNTLTVTGVMSGAGSIINATAASILNLASTPTITTLTATAVGNTVNYTGAAAQTVKLTAGAGGQYHNLGLLGAGVKTMPTNFQINGTTTVGSTIGLGANGTKVFVGLVTINAGGVWNNAVNRAVTFRGGLTHNGATFTAGTGLYTFSTATPQSINCTAPSTMTIPSVTVTAPTVLTNNCNLTVSTALAGTGNFTNGASGTLSYSVAAAPAITTFIANTAGNTVNYTGAAQTVRPVAYSNLGLSGSGIKTLTGVSTVGGNLTMSGAAGTSATVATPLTVGGNLSLAAGNTLANGANAVSLAGNFAQNGTFTAGAGVFTLTGTTPHNISGTGALGFNNLTVSNSGSITLARNVTVTSAISGTFTLTQVCPDYTLTSNGGVTVQHTCSSLISSINRANANPTTAATVSWTVIFNQSVSGVDASAFGLVATGLTGTSIASVTGSGTTWTVTANTGSGIGTLGLNQTGPGVVVPTLSGTFTGQVYDVSIQTCFTDNFNRADGVPAGNWVVANEGGTFGNPKIVSNRLRLTDATGGVSTMAALQQLFPAAGNKVVVVFDYFAYGGTVGADGIGVVLSDASVAPVPGAFGGSLGYAPKQASAGGDTTHPGFAGGWIGLAVDEYGNFSANTEGRSGGAAPGLTVDSIAVRGSGSGYTGYPYHRGTATLTPGIDLLGATPAPGHRYRITIDHTNGTNAWTSVERDTTGTGTAYAALVAPYDAKAEIGQAAVPTNWFLSFTGATGGSTNIHEVDNLQVCTAQPQPLPTLNHIRIMHNGQGLTCMPETVAVKACADASCSTLYLGSVTASLGTTGGTWSANPVTFTGGQATVTLAQLTAGNVTLSGAATAPVAVGSRCFNGATETCTLSFTDAGLILSSAAGGTEATVPTQTAGVASAQYVLRAVKTDKVTKACEGALVGAQTVNFGYECNDPSSCATGNLLSVNGTAVQSNPNGGGYSYTGISLTFDANGNTAPLTFSYEDVGQVTLRMLKAVNGKNLLGNSNAFIVKPDHFAVDVCAAATAGDCPLNTAATPIDGTGSVLAIAGTASTQTGAAFKATVRAMSANNNVTPSFSTAGSVAYGSETVLLGNTCVAPIVSPATVCPAAGVLNGSTSLTRNSFLSGIKTVSDLTWSEVGVLKLSASSSLFMGQASTAIGSSANAGRFKPGYFDTAVTGPMLCATGLCSVPITTMAYSGQTFAGATATAKNLAGSVTANYTGAFAKAVTLSAVNGVTGTTAVSGGALSGTAALVATDFANGVGTLTGVAATNAGAPIFSFTTVPTAPTDVYLHAVDTDAVASGTSPATQGGAKVVSGRIKIPNAYGSELLPLTLLATAQYYSSTSWVTSLTDSATTLSGVSSSYAVGAGTTLVTLTPLSGTLASGILSIKLGKPTPTGTGKVTVTPTSTATYLPVTPGTATFGVYQQRKEFIYMRESY
ncbi:MAG: DUF6701 domain-containing protein [Gallionellaceae bacterium]